MTIAMGRLHALLDNRECYPLPPREIVERVAIASDKQDARTSRLLAHFSYEHPAVAVSALGNLAPIRLRKDRPKSFVFMPQPSVV